MDRKISEYFTRKEFACRCGCGFDTVDAELVALLDRIRGYFQAPVIVSSCCRCEAHNRQVGGTKGSQHLKGRAADFTVTGKTPEEVQRYADLIGVPGLGFYDSFTHIDTRQGQARWGG